MYFSTTTQTKGFTLIEMLVSSAIFLSVVTVGISSLLVMHRASKITQYKKEQLDTLNAVMEDMVRNIRVGHHIRCSSFGDYSNVEEPLSCVNSNGEDAQASQSIAFEGVDGVDGVSDDQIGYVIAQDPVSGQYAIFKTTGPDGTSLGSNAVRITPESITMSDDGSSGFTVSHAENTDIESPLVTIRLAGTITYQGSTTPFIIQTATIQRTPKS